MLSDIVFLNLYVIQQYYEKYFIVMIQRECNIHTPTEGLLFELIPYNKNVLFDVLFQQVNILFLQVYLNDISTMSITIWYQACFEDNEHDEAAIDLQIANFQSPSLYDSQKNLVQYCNHYLEALSVFSYSITKIQFFVSQNCINTNLFSQLQL